MKQLHKSFVLFWVVMSMLFICAVPVLAAGSSSSKPRNQIVTVDNVSKYYDKSGRLVKKKFVTLKKKTYYCDAKGIIKKDGLFKVGSKTYYANENGVIAKSSFVILDEKYYFFDSKGVRKTGWIDYNKHTYYLPASGIMYNDTWKKIGKYYYYFSDQYYIRKNKWIDGYYVGANGRRIISPNSNDGKKRTISMTNVRQNPELPTGCESVALTSVLKFYGYSLSKTTIASSYLPRSSSNFVTAFMGNPFSGSGCGIYAPGLTNTANKFLKAKKSPLKAYNISGKKLSDLYSYIDEGYPVIVWNTMYMRNPIPIYTYRCLGKKWTFYTYEHCVVLCGYDKTKKKVLINDPLSGMVWRKASSFTSLYNKLGKMAIVIK